MTDDAASDGGVPDRIVGRHGAAMPMVLMYHSVTPYEQDPYRITVSPARFERQLRWLRRRGLRGVSMGVLINAWRSGQARGLIGLTFDDGYADFVEYALPVLDRYGFSATAFPVAGLLGGYNDWNPEGPRKPMMTVAHVRQAAEAGIEIGSHGMTHTRLPGTPAGALADEATESRAILRAASGQDVTGFCYPYGYVDAAVADAARAAGYSYGCAMWRTPEAGLFAIPRAYVDDEDTCVHLIAKEVKHLLTWGYSWAY